MKQVIAKNIDLAISKDIVYLRVRDASLQGNVYLISWLLPMMTGNYKENYNMAAQVLETANSELTETELYKYNEFRGVIISLDEFKAIKKAIESYIDESAYLNA